MIMGPPVPAAVRRGGHRPLATRVARLLSSIVLLGTVLAASCHREVGEKRPLVVLAASSLTETFGELEASFEATHPEIEVTTSFAGSQALRVQIEQGAPADAYASAAPVHMEALVAQGLVTHDRLLAYNSLVLVVSADTDSHISSLKDLPRARRIVLGTPDVPVGIYARRLLAAADARYGEGFSGSVIANVVSEEANVRLVLAKVELGEADAAIVYRTDVVAAAGVRTIAIDEELDAPAEVRIGVVRDASQPAAARAFVEYVTGPTGRATLQRHGFRAPEAPP